MTYYAMGNILIKLRNLIIQCPKYAKHVNFYNAHKVLLSSNSIHNYEHI